MNNTNNNTLNFEGWLKITIKHPIVAIITYTIFIAGTAFAGYKWMYDENRMNSYKAQTEQLQTEISQYKTRIEIVEKENTDLKTINQEYIQWIEKSENPLPFYRNKIKDLTISLNKPTNASTTSASTANGKYNKEYAINKGDSIVDNESGVVVGIRYIDSTNTAQITIASPDNLGRTDFYANIRNGKTFQFTKVLTTYVIAIKSIDYLQGKVHIIIYSL